MLTLAALTSCGSSDGGEQSGAAHRRQAQVADAGPATITQHGHHRHTPVSATRAGGGDDGPSPDPSGSAELGESLRFGSLEVRALDYRKAGFEGGATGTRVDVVTVEECAEGGSTRVQHQTWRLVDGSGRTLGVAGGKIVNGNPTEDLPETLAAGQCLTTALAIGVPAGSAPVAVQAGPDDTWVLGD
jgi:hypothetical protein